MHDILLCTTLEKNCTYSIYKNQRMYKMYDARQGCQAFKSRIDSYKFI